MKKWLAVLLMSCLLLSLVACGNQEESKESSDSVASSTSTTEVETQTGTTEEADEKPFAGMHLKIWGPNLDYKDQVFEKPSGNWWMYYAIEEWCTLNDCTWEFQVGNSDTNVLMSSIAAGEVYDLYVYTGQFPMISNIGGIIPIDEYYDSLKAEFVGFDISRYALDYNGHVYGIANPWASSMMISYDRTLFEDLGVKTPREYFMEGNWTFETYFQTIREVTRDTNGDGKYDIVGGTKERCMYLVGTPYTMNDDGTISPNVDTERNRDYFNEVYNLYKVEAVMDGTFMSQVKNDADGQYHAMAVAGVDYSAPSNLITTNEEGHVIETVPLPKWKADETEYFNAISTQSYCVPKSAQNVEASVSLMAYLLKAVAKEVEIKSEGNIALEFDGIQGILAGSEAYNKAAKAAAEEKTANLHAMPEYDAEFIKAVIDYMENAPKLQRYTFVDMPSTFNSKFSVLWNEPTATAIATATETAKGFCDKYNSNYVH